MADVECLADACFASGAAIAPIESSMPARGEAEYLRAVARERSTDVASLLRGTNAWR